VKEEDFFDKLLNNMDNDKWRKQFQEVLAKTVIAQAKYIRLLEAKIGK
jgi:hypothetical protein